MSKVVLYKYIWGKERKGKGKGFEDNGISLPALRCELCMAF